MKCTITLDVNFFHYAGDTPSTEDVAQTVCHLLDTHPYFSGYDGIKIESVKVNQRQTEPKITINGAILDNAQAMTIRVALESFFLSLKGEGLGDDANGLATCEGYLNKIREIREIMGY
jgi:hypothetical protein